MRWQFHRRLMAVSLLLLTGLILTYSGIYQVRADELEEISRQIDDLRRQLELSRQATTPLEAEVKRLRSQIKAIQGRIDQATGEIGRLEKSIEEREEGLKQRYVLLVERVRDYYKQLRARSPLAVMLAARSAREMTQGLVYREVVADRDRELIVRFAREVMELERDKQKLELDRERLRESQSQLDEQRAFFEREIAGAKDWQSKLEKKIAELTRRQQEILAARSGSVITSVGEVPVVGDYDATLAGFRERAPGGYFAVFSFGAYTHRKGMSQYGAKGRAESGQGYRDILRAYYGGEPVSKDTGGGIRVAGYGELDFEGKYLLGIAEMPSDWPVEALKAQAVAARTYAYRYKLEGREICVTEACQVFSMSKANNPPENWRRAVEETRGQVLEGVVTYYSSTAGGYLTTMGWDTEDGRGEGEWSTKAWEKKANSPWFYKAWYRQGYQDSSSACGRKPWLSEEEMADIINSWLVLYRGEGEGVETSRVLPVTINSCPIGGSSGEPYSMTELRQKLANPVTNISGVPVSQHDGQGNTVKVVFETNRGRIEIPGYEFKEVFNMRAPGYISIPQKGFAFFNIERK